MIIIFPNEAINEREALHHPSARSGEFRQTKTIVA